MSPVTHFLAGWLLANAAELDRRDRALVSIAGVIPDLDGLGIVAEVATRNGDHPLTWWSDYHHVLGHNIGFCALVTACSFLLARRRAITAVLVCVSFHAHLLGDLVGARGPDGHQWPLPYLLPFSNRWQLVWTGQWPLNAWPNVLLTAVALALTLYLGWKRGFSPLEMISRSADRRFIETLRNRFPRGEPASNR